MDPETEPGTDGATLARHTICCPTSKRLRSRGAVRIPTTIITLQRCKGNDFESSVCAQYAQAHITQCDVLGRTTCSAPLNFQQFVGRPPSDNYENRKGDLRISCQLCLTACAESRARLCRGLALIHHPNHIFHRPKFLADVAAIAGDMRRYP
jgi:hypothetical protein